TPLEDAHALVVGLGLLRALHREAERLVVLAPLGRCRTAEAGTTSRARTVGLAGVVVVHALIGGDDVLGPVVVVLLAVEEEGGSDRVTQAQDDVRRVLGRVHGRDARLHLLGRGV